MRTGIKMTARTQRQPLPLSVREGNLMGEAEETGNRGGGVTAMDFSNAETGSWKQFEAKRKKSTRVFKEGTVVV